MAAVRKQFRRQIGRELGPLQTECKAELCDLFLKYINAYLAKVGEAIRAWDSGESTETVIMHLRGAEIAQGRVYGQVVLMKKLNMPDVLRFFQKMYNDTELDRADATVNELWELVL
jgi:hypothetical protein